jgi:cell wall-associated NlpC family hydrolase
MKNKAVGAIAAFMALLLFLLFAVQIVSDDETTQQQTVSASGTGTALKPGTVPPQYEAWVIEAGQQCPDVPAPFIAAQIETESNWNPMAVSPAGAQGLTQFMPGTWATFGEGSPFDPRQAIKAQAKYDCYIASVMKPLIAQGKVKGDLLDTISWSYNAGEGAVIANGGVPRYAETIAYAPKIREKMGKYTDLGVPPRVLASGGRGNGAKYVYQPGVPQRQQAVAAAMTALGLPYAWGGGDRNGPTKGIRDGGVADAHGDYNKIGFDCSGLVLWALFVASNGQIKLDHSSYTQAKAGSVVPLSQLQPGDLIVMSGGSHIAIARGDGTMVEAPESGSFVKVSPLRGGEGVHIRYADEAPAR